jgi:hypothetical protein
MPGLSRRSINVVSSSHTQAGDRGVGDRRQTFSRYVVDDIEDPKSPAAGELIMDEIQRPAGVGGCLNEDRRPRSYGAPPRPPLAHREAFVAIVRNGSPSWRRRMTTLGSRSASARWGGHAVVIGVAYPATGRTGSGSSCDRHRRWSKAPRSDRPITACRCATPSRLAAGPTIFLKEARATRRRPASDRPAASSASRSPPRAASAAWPRRHPYRRAWPSSCTASLPKRLACAPNRRSWRQPRAPSAPQ